MPRHEYYERMITHLQFQTTAFTSCNRSCADERIEHFHRIRSAQPERHLLRTGSALSPHHKCETAVVLAKKKVVHTVGFGAERIGKRTSWSR